MSETPTTGFSLDVYAQLVQDFLSRGYSVVDYARAQSGHPNLILRHDVDVCLERAVAMAEKEQELGVSAIYYVLIRSGLYNALSEENVARMRAIAACGHAIGLHFDATIYDGLSEDELQTAIARECYLLEQMSGLNVATVSFHRPAKQFLGYPDHLAGRLHAYMPRFFSEMGYCSDSRGGWYHGHPLEHAAVAEKKALQLVTHPIWWVASEQESAMDKLNRLVAGQNDAYRKRLAENVTPYREAL